jgi:hypothetical protein
VRKSAFAVVVGAKRTWAVAPQISAFDPADIRLLSGADFVKMPKIQLFKKIFASPKFPLLKNKGHFPSRLPPGAN